MCRMVREKSVEILGLLSGLVGRGLAPYLKHVLGPWIMARHDLQLEVSSTAKTALSDTFPDTKLQGALLLYSEQVSCYLEKLEV